MTETTDDLEAMCVRVAQAMGYRWWCFTPYGALPVLREPEFEHDLVATRYMARCEQPSHITEAMLSMVPRPDRDPAAFCAMMEWMREQPNIALQREYIRYLGFGIGVLPMSGALDAWAFALCTATPEQHLRAVAAAIRAREEAGDGC